MKNTVYNIYFGDKLMTVYAVGLKHAKIIALYHRIKAGLNTEITKITIKNKNDEFIEI